MNRPSLCMQYKLTSQDILHDIMYKTETTTLRAGCTHLSKWLTKCLTIWLAVDALLATLILG